MPFHHISDPCLRLRTKARGPNIARYGPNAPCKPPPSRSEPEALDAVGACWGPYQTVRQAGAEDPDLSAENPMFSEIEQPGIGRYLAAGSFIDFSGIPREPAVPAPTLGSNTESVLTEKLGLTNSDLSTLKDGGVI